jgi:hypothetical protein
MPQPPLLVDQLQIEPGSGDTLTIDRDSTDGALKFVDAVITGGALLPNLVDIRNITGVYTVGRAGDGAMYTTIQSALDAIPAATSSATSPSLVLIFPGVYQEDLTITKDGVYMVGMGRVRVVNNTATDTITVKASIDSTPQDVLFQGLEVECNEAGEAAIYVLGADTFSTGTITVNGTPITAGDTVVVGGVTLTGISGTRTSGSNDFSVNGTTTDAIAAEIVAAIMDPANSFTDIVTAESALNVITLTAVTAGSSGDAITLAVTVVVAGDLVPSGATLAGGSAAGNMVLNGAMNIKDCHLIASGVGSYQVLSDTVNHVYIEGGTFRGSSSTSILQASNNAVFKVRGVDWMNDVQFAYDTGNDQPNDVSTGSFELRSCNRLKGVLQNLVGLGSFVMSNCSEVETLAQDGDQTLRVVDCTITGASSFGTTTAATLVNTVRSTVSVSGGTPTLAETRSLGSAVLAATGVFAITFDVPQPDNSYTVLVEQSASNQAWGVQNKLATGFDLYELSGSPHTGTINYTVIRSL